MINKWDVKQYYKRHEDELDYRINENDMVVHKGTGAILYSLDNFIDYMRKALHCDFECIYSCHGTLEIVLRCKECGAVIFASDDADYYDDNLCCPVCANYNTYFKYYTNEEILLDKNKQEEINLYEEMAKEQFEADKRRERRSGKYDWEIFKGHVKIGSDKRIYYCLKCDNLFKHGLKGLKLILDYAVKDNDVCYIFKKHVTIPLSYGAFKIQRLIKEQKNENLGG